MGYGVTKLPHLFIMIYLTIAPNGVIAALGSGLLEAEAATFRKVLLVVLFSTVEFLCWKNLSHDLAVECLLEPLQ